MKRGPESLEELRREVEEFIHSLEHPLVEEDGEELFDLSVSQWRAALEFGKLVFEAWNNTRSVSRRIEEVAYRDGRRLGVFARHSRSGRLTTLEFREQDQAAAGAGRATLREEFSRRFASMLTHEYSAWRLERVSHRSDREFSFSTWYTRGLARQGQNAWAFLGLGEQETPEAADSLLAFGVIWLDWLRTHVERTAVAGLKVFIPAAAIECNLWRVKCLNQRAVKVELFEWQPDSAPPRQVDVEANSELEITLTARRQGEMLLERHGEMLRAILQSLYDRVNIVPNASGKSLSVRVAGLEVARVEGDLSPRVLFGLEGSIREYRPRDRQKLHAFIQEVIERRTPSNLNRQDLFYRLQSERWLESILIGDMTKVDPELSPQFVYSQVPSFAGNDRGVMDVLGVSRGGRLAVIELKLEEEINLPFQALDYWMRVAHLAKQGVFQKYGYFPETTIQTLPPRLYLVAPAFRFHSSLETLLRYFDPAIEVIRVGINQGWRDGVQVLYRQGRPKRLLAD